MIGVDATRLGLDGELRIERDGSVAEEGVRLAGQALAELDDLMAQAVRGHLEKNVASGEVTTQELFHS